jgi:hypothetical protein
LNIESHLDDRARFNAAFAQAAAGEVPAPIFSSFACIPVVNPATVVEQLKAL